jgi:hypothetical protein
MTDLHYLPATQVVQAFRDRELSAVELVTVVMEREETVEPVINALAQTFFEALEQAGAAEAGTRATADCAATGGSPSSRQGGGRDREPARLRGRRPGAVLRGSRFGGHALYVKDHALDSIS